MACRLQPSAVPGVQRDVHFGHGRVVCRDEDHRYSTSSHSHAIAVRLERLLLNGPCSHIVLVQTSITRSWPTRWWPSTVSSSILSALPSTCGDPASSSRCVHNIRIQQLRSLIASSSSMSYHHSHTLTTHTHTLARSNTPRHQSGSQPRFQRSTRARMAIQRLIWRA